MSLEAMGDSSSFSKVKEMFQKKTQKPEEAQKGQEAQQKTQQGQGQNPQALEQAQKGQESQKTQKSGQSQGANSGGEDEQNGGNSNGFKLQLSLQMGGAQDQKTKTPADMGQPPNRLGQMSA